MMLHGYWLAGVQTITMPGGACTFTAGKEERGRGEVVAAASSAAPALRVDGIWGNTCQPQCVVTGGRNNGRTLQIFAQPYIPFIGCMFLNFWWLLFLIKTSKIGIKWVVIWGNGNCHDGCDMSLVLGSCNFFGEAALRK
jgi:hypothetical protein